jgi:hypothetical protein
VTGYCSTCYSSKECPDHDRDLEVTLWTLCFMWKDNVHLFRDPQRKRLIPLLIHLVQVMDTLQWTTPIILLLTDPFLDFFRADTCLTPEMFEFLLAKQLLFFTDEYHALLKENDIVSEKMVVALGTQMFPLFFGPTGIIAKAKESLAAYRAANPRSRANKFAPVNKRPVVSDPGDDRAKDVAFLQSLGTGSRPLALPPLVRKPGIGTLPSLSSKQAPLPPIAKVI